jgi:hypothetical protein
MQTKICTKCKGEFSLSQFYYHRPRKRYMETCKTCSKKISTTYQHRIKKENNLTHQLRSRASEITRRAKMKNIPCDKHLFQILMDLYKDQKGLCYYTKLPMATHGYHVDDPLCFVVDRCDPKLGYVKSNIVFCCNCINRIKSSYTFDQVKRWVSLIQ